jgi:hypothetical protein
MTRKLPEVEEWVVVAKRQLRPWMDKRPQHPTVKTVKVPVAERVAVKRRLQTQHPSVKKETQMVTSRKQGSRQKRRPHIHPMAF